MHQLHYPIKKVRRHLIKDKTSGKKIFVLLKKEGTEKTETIQICMGAMNAYLQLLLHAGTYTQYPLGGAQNCPQPS
jgi:hypothetical protein